ncbi:MAG: glycosyltransferase [Megasphaera elsdenii]|nr:glycosyltransferase [Megasphaera elsdenii]
MENQEPFFSIIMPVYNAEKYVEAAVESVLQQSYTDFELLLVDDCSADSSYSVCQELAKKDGRIKLLRTPQNGGAAVARNFAFQHIQGKYLTFIDSDDIIEPNLLSVAYSYVKDDQADCVKFGCFEEYFNADGEKAYSKKCCLTEQVYDNSDTIRQQMVRMELIPLFGYLWNAIYRASIILDKGLLFNDQYRVNEDFDFNIRYFKYVQRLQCSSYCGYHYAKRLNNLSLSTKNNDEYYDLHMMKIREFLQNFPSIESIDAQTMSNIFWLYTRFVYSAVQRKMVNNEPINTFIKDIRSSDLFAIYQSVHFVDIGVKQKIMISILRSKYEVLLHGLLHGISFVRIHCPFIFAAVKR